MKPPYFIAGILLGAAAILIFWPKSTHHSNPENLTQYEESTLNPPSAHELLNNYRAASSKREKYIALKAFGRITSSEFPAMLNKAIIDGGESKLSSEALGLLNHWAERAPKSALLWSWQNLRNDSRWEIACSQIFKTWIASGDIEVVTFLSEVEKRKKPLAAEASQRDHPFFLHEGQMSRNAEWLYFYNEDVALAAYSNGINPPISSRRVGFYDRFKTVEEVEASLARWPENINLFCPQECIRQRGRELGMSFSREHLLAPSHTESTPGTPSKRRPHLSHYWNVARIDLSESLAQASELAPEFQQGAYTAIFDSWSLANEGREPDYSALPSEVQEIWKDLSKLGPINNHPNTPVLSK